jgi:hypothetical protein
MLKQHERKMADHKLPETPFNGVIVARDVSQFCDYSGKEPRFGTKISLLIVPEDDTSNLPVTVTHSFTVAAKTEPWIFLREGHKVRVTRVEDQNGFAIVTHFSLNDREVAATARAALAKAQKEAAKVEGTDETSATAKDAATSDGSTAKAAEPTTSQ